MGIVVIKDSKYGYYDYQGNAIKECLYDEIGSFNQGIALIKVGTGVDALYGYMNYRGEEVVKPKYGVAYPFRDGIAIVEIGGKKGIINRDGREILYPKYDTIFSPVLGQCIVGLDSKVGLFNVNNKTMVLDVIYDTITQIEDLQKTDYAITTAQHGYSDI